MNRWPYLLTVALIVGVQAHGQSPTVAEQYLLTAINQERAAHGLAPVQPDMALQQAAAAHAQLMANQKTISHQLADEPDLPTRASQTGAHFARITENVAEGPSVAGLHSALMKSQGHRTNILDPAVDAIGLAVISRNGQLYAVEDFQATVKSLTLEQQEAAIALLLDAAGIELLPSADARQTCAMPTGYAGHTQPDFILHFTTNNLSHLPAKLRDRLATSQEHRASIGACNGTGATAFSQYTLAVMLYP